VIGALAIYSRLSPPRTLGICCMSPLDSGGLGSGTLPYWGRRAAGLFGNSLAQRQMLIEAVSLGVIWTAQRHGTSIGYVQLNYELARYYRDRSISSTDRPMSFAVFS